MMKKRAFLVLALILFMLTQIGCVASSKKVGPVVVASPSLSEQLDNLYAQDPDGWTYRMERLLESKHLEIPPKHLIYALEAFNSQKTGKSCLDAAYLYLRSRVDAGKSLNGTDKDLFTAYMEFALTHPQYRALEDAEQLCIHCNEPLCKEL